jgi:hypothetical protein
MERLKVKLLVKVLLVSIIFLNISCGSRDVTVTWSSIEGSAQSNNFKLKVFIENSGSMDGYMCPGSELKDAVYSYASSLSSYADTTELNYINSRIIPYRYDMRRFIKDLDPYHFHVAGGNTSNSDISAMFESILNQTDDHTVSIFVSDCILDVPNGDSMDFFENRSIDIRNAFTKHLNKHSDLGVEIFRLESTFDGRYYYSRGSELLNNVKRPYYMWVIGNKNILAHLNKQVPPFTEIKHGIKNYFAFSTNSNIPFEITNTKNIAKGNQCVPTKNSDGDYEFLIKTNLRSTLQGADVLANPSNYATITSGIIVNGITELPNSSTSSFTHIINVIITNTSKSYAEKITLKPLYAPSWLEEANDDTGKDVKKNMNKTTGIKYLVQGVADAYKKQEQLVDFKFVVNNR